MDWLKGIALALVTIFISWLMPAEVRIPFFAVLLGMVAGIYVGFSCIQTQKEELIQWIVGFFFVVIAVLGLWVSPVILGIAWILHGVWDTLHHIKLMKTETPKGYPVFCLSYDIILGGYIILQAFEVVS